VRGESVQHDGPLLAEFQLEIGGQKRIMYMYLLKNKQLSYRTELIKKKEGRKEERLFCPSLISVAVSVIIIISHAPVIEAVLLE
jgi:hypothetical protein